MSTMIGLDTNALGRYLVQDDVAQSQKATQLIERVIFLEESFILITSIIVCELVWGLESAYEYPKKDIIYAVEKVLKTRQFFIEHSEILWNSLQDYQKLVDFSDSYIAHLYISYKCSYTATFDKKPVRLKQFKLLT